MFTLSGGLYGGYTLEKWDSKIATAPHLTDDGESITIKVTSVDENVIAIEGFLYNKSLSLPRDTAEFV